MTKNIDKIKISLGDSVFNHISSLNKNQLEKQLSELKSELNLADKKSQRYIKLKDEEWYILYRLERTNEFKYAEGGGVGSISNQYDGKTGKKVWESWTATQKAHFLKDHFYSVGKKLPTKNIFAMKWSELPLYLQNAVSNHVYAGQYAKGGGVNWEMNWRSFTISDIKQWMNQHNYNDISVELSSKGYHKYNPKKDDNIKLYFDKSLDLRSGQENMYFDIVVTDDNNKEWIVSFFTKENRRGLKKIAKSIVDIYAKGGSVGSSFEYTIGGL